MTDNSTCLLCNAGEEEIKKERQIFPVDQVTKTKGKLIHSLQLLAGSSVLSVKRMTTFGSVGQIH